MLVHGQNIWPESWQSSPVQTYVPGGENLVFIPGDRGNWLVDDTVSAFLDDGCGPDQNKAEILLEQNNKFLKLTSAESPGDCAENIWVLLGHQNAPLSIPVTVTTRISFVETGFLEAPFWNGRFPTLTPPPGSNVHLFLEDNKGNILVYILQRALNYVAHTETFSAGAISVGYHEILLDTNGGAFNRSLHDDFSAVSGFNTNNTIRSIKFEITDLGFATLDDLRIGVFDPPTKVTVPDTVGMSEDAARLAIVNSNLLVGLTRFENNSSMPAGNVIEQDPAGGTEVDEGSAVDLIISSGPVITVPNIVGLSQVDAEATIAAAFLIVGNITVEHHESIPEGIVISQNPNADSEKSTGDPINFAISLGPAPPPDITVNSIGDGDDINPGDGICETEVGNSECSFRAALQEANALSGLHRIAFDIPGNGPHSIQPQSELTPVTEPVIIDGYTQLGATPNSADTGSNAILMVELDGSMAGQNSRGILVTGGESVIKGLIINRFSGPGIHLVNAGTNIVQGNFIGTDLSGKIDRGNGGSGISISSSPDNTIGGTAREHRNIIAGNGFVGISIQNSDRITIQGNLIGTDSTGTENLGNDSDGILLGVTSACTVGGESLGARNIISGNALFGIDLSSSASNCTIQGNFIGTDVSGSFGIGNNSGMVIAGRDNRVISNLISANEGIGIQIDGSTQENGTSGNQIQGNVIGSDITGSQALGNGNHGILLRIGSFSGFPPVNNLIGGELDTLGNLIAYNQGSGIMLMNGTENAIRSNTIHSNQGLGIDLGNAGISPNDSGDGDTGPNQLINFPDLTASVTSQTSTFLIGKLDSIPKQKLSIQYFANDTCDSSGHGEGQSLLGTLQLETGESGSTIFEVEIAEPIPAGQFVTAISTDTDGNTSEFSECIQVSLSTLVDVPDLSNQPSSAIEDILTLAGLKVGSITSERNSEIPPGVVIRQTPTPDSDLEFREAVDLVISSSDILLLQEGWNLISVPRPLTFSTLTSVPRGQFANSIWSFQNGRFHIVENLSPDKGYWIFGFSRSHWILPSP